MSKRRHKSEKESIKQKPVNMVKVRIQVSKDGKYYVAVPENPQEGHEYCHASLTQLQQSQSASKYYVVKPENPKERQSSSKKYYFAPNNPGDEQRSSWIVGTVNPTSTENNWPVLSETKKQLEMQKRRLLGQHIMRGVRKGVAHLFDFGGVYCQIEGSSIPRSGEEEDIIALTNDWRSVGSDLSQGLKVYVQSKKK